MAEVPSLLAILTDLPDYRHAQGLRHPLPAVLGLIACALLCGACSQQAIAEWIADLDPAWRHAFGLRHPHGPSQATLSRVLAHLEVAALEAALTHWTAALRAAGCFAPALASPDAPVPQPAAPPALPPLPQIAVDGKTLRGSAAAGQPGAHLLSAFAPQEAIVLAQRAVERKTNEIPVAPQLLAQLDIAGAVVTSDALLTQETLDQQILAAQGHYLHPVKANHRLLLRDIREVFASRELADTVQTTYDTRLQGGRIEERALSVSGALAGYSAWPGVRQVIEVWRVVTDKRTKRVRSEVAYALTSLDAQQADAAQLLELWQGHWGIENKLHWIRDVSMGEDACRVRSGAGPQVLAALRNAVLTLLRRDQVPNIAQAIRHYARHPELTFGAVGLLVG